MRTIAPFLLLSSAWMACVGAPSAHAGGLPVCNAKHKRPANLYGSVLSDGLKPVVSTGTEKPGPTAQATSTTAPSPASALTSAASPRPAQVSRAQLRASFAPCGEGGRA